MKNIPKALQKEFEKFLPEAKESLHRFNKDVQKLVAKSEKGLAEFYAGAKKKTEALLWKAKREELLYELGKAITPLLTSDQLKNKNILRIYSEIRDLDKRLKAKKR